MRDPATGVLATEPADLRGRCKPWRTTHGVVLLAVVAIGLALRGCDLSAEGFADDEVHEWLAAQRYLAGDLGGDGLEHPMLMKWLIVLTTVAARGALSPEALTRLPNVVAGGWTALAVALLGRRLFGRAAGVVAAALTAVSPTFVGYNRLAKEDTLCTLFLVLLLWCVAEAQAAACDARARDQARWEMFGGVCLGLMLASKYYLFLAPIPLLAHVSLRLGGSPWRVPVRRWASLLGVALAVFVPLDFVVLRPSTWTYIAGYLRGDAVGDRMTSESVLFMGRHFANFAFQLREGPPLTYWPIFAGVKLAPTTVLLGCAGLGIALVQRRPAHRILLAWIGMWLLSFTVASVKYARYFVSVLPALLLLASMAAVLACQRIATAWRTEARAARRGRSVATAVALVWLAAAVAPELAASSRLAPHYRLYVSSVGGGERNVGWFFPQCDYGDAGAREAIRFIAARAEPTAEIASEIVWPVRFYAAQADRLDLRATHLARETACRTGHVCYVLVQEGRTYWHNRVALDRLAASRPWHVERIRGADVVRVYRLLPGDVLFPPSLE